jgi:hypothetical protein
VVKNCIISVLLAVCLMLGYSNYSLSQKYVKEHIKHVLCQAAIFEVSSNLSAKGLSMLQFQGVEGAIEDRAWKLLEQEGK